MSDNQTWLWTVWQWAVLVVLVLLAAAVVVVDIHIVFVGGWPPLAGPRQLIHRD
jgi:hypothetical protein